MLPYRSQWNQDMAYVYRHIEEGFGKIRRIHIPKMGYIKGVEEHEFDVSFQNEKVIESWVKLLGLSRYAMCIDGENETLGLVIIWDERFDFVVSEHVMMIEEHEYLCLLTYSDDTREQVKRMPEIQMYLNEHSIRFVEKPWIRIYTMIQHSLYGEYLNYLLIPIENT